MTTNFSHTNCTHPSTSKARAACRKAHAAGRPVEVDPLTSVLPAPPSTHLSTDGHMGRADAARIVHDLLAEHNLDGWKVSFNNRRRAAGLCNYTYRQIILSLPLMAQRSWADTHMTITHEIAHALCPGHNHDHVWAAMHRSLGGNGLRCFEHEDEDAPWIGTCEHGKRYMKYRAPKRLTGWRCKCVRGGSPVTWERNPNA